MISNCDITIYNKYIVNRAEQWQRTVILQVAWESTKAIAGQRFQQPANTVTIFIPFDRKATGYATPKQWQALTDKTGRWTLQEGDVIVRGSVDDEIVGDFTITSLRAAYDDVVSIASVDAMDLGSASMQHFEVGCK